jgi:IS30 family transposase
MSSYKQLTYEQRCQIEVLKKSGFSQQSIADAVGSDQSTISRDLTRNTGLRGYRHRQAQMRTNKRREQAVRPSKMTAATIKLLTPFKDLVLSITAGNGKEFAYHEQIAAKLACDVYFANPYCSWERGLNENTNGLIRQSFPKSTDLSKVTDKEVRRAIDRLNKRPRKFLGYKAPAFAMKEKMAALVA